MAAAAFGALSARTRLRSFKETVVLLTVVCVPRTVRLPLMIKSPPSESVGAGSMINWLEPSVELIVLPSILILSTFNKFKVWLRD